MVVDGGLVNSRSSRRLQSGHEENEIQTRVTHPETLSQKLDHIENWELKNCIPQ